MKSKTKSKLQLFAVALLACSSLVALSACEMGGDDDEDQPSQEEPAPTDGSQSRSQLAGSYRFCETMTNSGSALNGQVLVRYLTLNADGTYSGLMAISAATACAYGAPSGSSDVWGQVNTSGTWTVGGTPGTPSDGTKISLAPSAISFTVYNPAGVTGARKLAEWGRDTCASNNFNPSATSGTGGTLPSNCGGPLTPNVNLVYNGVIGLTQQNIIKKLSTKETGQISNLWGFGAGGFPSSYTATWY